MKQARSSGGSRTHRTGFMTTHTESAAPTEAARSDLGALTAASMAFDLPDYRLVRIDVASFATNSKEPMSQYFPPFVRPSSVMDLQSQQLHSRQLHN
jgi:hypothetical protein